MHLILACSPPNPVPPLSVSFNNRSVEEKTKKNDDIVVGMCVNYTHTLLSLSLSLFELYLSLSSLSLSHTHTYIHTRFSFFLTHTHTHTYTHTHTCGYWLFTLLSCMWC